MIGIIVVVLWWALIFGPVYSERLRELSLRPPPYDTCVCEKGKNESIKRYEK